MNRRAFVAGSACGLLGSLAGCSSPVAILGEETRTESRTYAVGESTRLRVRNHNGPVTVEGHDAAEVAVEIEVRGPSSDSLAAVSVTDAQTENELELETVYDDSAERRRASVALTIRCPETVSVERVRTNNGSVEVTGVEGNPELETQNGELVARNIGGTVSLTASSGRITARNIGGIAGARTSNGAIDIDIPAIDEDVDVRTANGSIDAALASDLDATVSATTSNGSVNTHNVDFSSSQISQTSVSGSLGDGSHDLAFETSNGSIDLRRLES